MLFDWQLINGFYFNAKDLSIIEIHEGDYDIVWLI